MTNVNPTCMYKLFFIVLLLLASSLTSAGGLDGEPRALARIDTMLASMGGRELWANARSVFTMERARHPKYGDGIIASFWRDLEQPGEYGRYAHRKLDLTYIWNEKTGWVQRNGELRDYSEAELEERHYYWSREIYILFHQLAAGTRKLTVKSFGDDGFSLFDEAGDRIGDFRLTPEGDLYMWQQFGGEAPVTYIYGPHKDFGELSFPDWGTATDGSWGFYYLQVLPNEKPFSYHTSLARPKLHWDGGAVNVRQHDEDCVPVTP